MNIHIILVNQSLLKGLRLVMWSLLHDTDQLREMLSADQSLRDRRSRGLWSVLICVMQQLTEPPVSNPIIICFHKIGPNNCVILQVYVPNALNVTLNKVNIDCVEYVNPRKSAQGGITGLGGQNEQK